MAALIPVRQEFFDTNTPGLAVCLTTVTLLSASDTITLPTLANSASGASVKHLRRSGDASITVTSSGFTVTLVGVAGDTHIVASLHEGHSTFNPEEAIA